MSDNKGFDCTIIQRAQDCALKLLSTVPGKPKHHLFLAAHAAFSRYGSLSSVMYWY